MTVAYTTVEVGPMQFVVRWKQAERGTCVTHLQDWNKLELLASVVTGHGEFVQMLGTLTEADPRSTH